MSQIVLRNMMTGHETTMHAASTGALGMEDFARLFGTSVEGLPSQCRNLISQGDFRYQAMTGPERDRVLLDILKRADSGDFTEAGRKNIGTWETAWARSLKSFRQGGSELSSLVPTYIGYDRPVLRLHQTLVTPTDPNFQLNWYRIFQHWLFTTYFKDAETVYEFGCGSGINLAALAQLYPEKRYVGLDWSLASNQIVNELTGPYGWNMEGRRFDFFSPDENIEFDNGSVVLTVDALEQTGQDYEAFLEYLMRRSPALCVNIEPIVEWYDEDNLVDYSAIRYHKRRKYLEGLPNRLKELERDGRIEIIKTHRCNFGTMFVEGYSHLIWRPIPGV